MLFYYIDSAAYICALVDNILVAVVISLMRLLTYDTTWVSDGL